MFVRCGPRAHRHLSPRRLFRTSGASHSEAAVKVVVQCRRSGEELHGCWCRAGLRIQQVDRKDMIEQCQKHGHLISQETVLRKGIGEKKSTLHFKVECQPSADGRK